ncbi:MAG TPA: SUMF1/EgtB/PvdO family nonheme iron enzyme [Solirubrobacterales bacterium]|nr:SUMF1/EgtB/PvdO family nonheme iron enzyme [Solirubrobacterales bacterium]
MPEARTRPEVCPWTAAIVGSVEDMTAKPKSAPPQNEPSREDMQWVQGGDFLMGSEDFYPEEAPVHRVRVGGFWIDRHPVTNAQFESFVAETGYETVAERPLNPTDYPGAPVELLVPGSLVFLTATPRPSPRRCGACPDDSAPFVVPAWAAAADSRVPADAGGDRFVSSHSHLRKGLRWHT